MIFTNKGVMYRLLVDNIPVGTNASVGTPIKALISMDEDEQPSTIYSIYRDTDAQYVLFVTKNGIVKKTSLEEYTKTKKKCGIGAITLKEGDTLASVSLVKDEDIILVSAGGGAIRFPSTEVSASGRATAGVKGMTLKEDDYIVAALPIRDKKDQLGIFVQNGLGKKVELSEFPVQKRAGKGLQCVKLSQATGFVAAAALINDSDTILIAGTPKSICIAAADVPTTNRPAVGNQLLNGSKVTSVSKV